MTGGPPVVPGGVPLLGHMLTFLRRPFTAPLEWARHGDVVRLRAPGPPTLMLFAPEPIGDLLVKHAASTRKGASSRGLACVTGASVVTISGEPWKRRRRLLEPAFRKDQLARHLRAVHRQAERRAELWLASGRVEAHGELLDFMFDALIDALTSAPLGPDRAVLRRGFEVFWSDFSSREFALLSVLGDGEPYRWFATPRRRRQLRLLAEFDRIVARLVEHARASPGDDMLSALVESSGGDGGLQARELREDVTTLILAAQETTAMGLTMTLDLIARHPDVADRVAAEAAALPAGVPGPDDLQGLQYTDAVVREALRLYPPIWGVARETTAPLRVGGHAVEPGSVLVAASWVVHRDPRWWGDDPLVFRPERWLEDRARPRLAWLPFGAGPHTCIGMRFALVEMVLAVAVWARRLRLRADADPPELDSSVTLRPRRGVPLRVSPRG